MYTYNMNMCMYNITHYIIETQSARLPYVPYFKVVCCDAPYCNACALSILVTLHVLLMMLTCSYIQYFGAELKLCANGPHTLSFDRRGEKL